MRSRWILQDGKWINSVTSEVDSRPGAGCQDGPPRVNTGQRPKPGERCFAPSESMQRDLRNRQKAMEEARLARRREKWLQLDRDIEAGKVRVDPTATLGSAVVEVKEGDVRHIVRADKLSNDEKRRAKQAVAAEIAARQEREAARAPIDEAKLSAELEVAAAKAPFQPDKSGYIHRYSLAEGHDPSLPKPTPKPGANRHRMESFDLSDLRSLPPSMRGSGIS